MNRHATSLRAGYDLANLQNSRFIYQTGERGLVFTPRYRDMRSTWTQVGCRRLQRAPARMAHDLRLWCLRDSCPPPA